MQDFLDAVIFGFNEILKTNVMKFAMISGMVVSAIWVFIGVFFWSDIIAISDGILDLLPFSLIRSNGAWMLSTFIWLQLVLITFAIIFTFMGSLSATEDDREKFAAKAVLVGLGSALFWGVVWWFGGDYIYEQFLKLLTWLPFETVEKSLAYLIGFYIIYTGIIVSLIFVATLFSSKFLYNIKQKHFPYDRMYEDHGYNNIKQALKDTAIFAGASVLSFPLLFIPIVNFIILVGLWVWLMKETFTYDVAAFVFDEINKEKLKEYKAALWGITILGSMFNFIPILNAFAPYFTQITMFYYLKEKRDSYRD
jgi:hypothetical protein